MAHIAWPDIVCNYFNFEQYRIENEMQLYLTNCLLKLSGVCISSMKITSNEVSNRLICKLEVHLSTCKIYQNVGEKTSYCVIYA